MEIKNQDIIMEVKSNKNKYFIQLDTYKQLIIPVKQTNIISEIEKKQEEVKYLDEQKIKPQSEIKETKQSNKFVSEILFQIQLLFSLVHSNLNNLG